MMSDITKTAEFATGRETTVRLADHETVVLDSGGDGIPVLLIHALSMDRRFWREVWPVLAGPGRVIAYDIRGHGFASGAPLTTGLEQLADDAACLLDALAVPAADVYGASFGGAIAQHLALRRPDKTRSLALIATASKAPRELLEARAISAEQHGMEAQVPPSLMRWFLPETVAADGRAVRYARECVRRSSVAEWSAAWRAMAGLDVLDRLPDIGVPAIAIAGQQDVSATPAAMRQTAAGIPGCRYALIDPGTHMMALEQPQALARELSEFRQSVNPPHSRA